MIISLPYEELDSIIDFTKWIYKEPLDQKRISFFKKTPESNTKFEVDKNLEWFLKGIEYADFFTGQLKIGGNKYSPIRYFLSHSRRNKEEKFMELECALFGNNLIKLRKSYNLHFGKDFYKSNIFF